MTVIACRICLAYDVVMYSLLNSPLQQIYERLTNLPFHTKDGRPTTVCYICHHQLKKCHKFMLKSATSDEMFSLLLSSGVEVRGSTLDIVRKQSRDVSWCLKMTPIEYLLSQETKGRDEAEVRVEVVKIEEDTSDQPECCEEETQVGDEAAVVKMEEDTFDQPEHVEEAFLKLAKGKDINITQAKPQNEPIAEEKAVKINKKAKQTNVDIKAQKENALVQKSKYYECEICKKKFTQSGNLKNHFRIHTKEKPYECDICKKRFTLNGDLKSHYRIHTKEKPYECEICKKRFIQKAKLIIHYRVHTKEKPYECEICKKRFTDQRNLKIHYRIHTKEKPHECEICKKRFYVNSALKRHYRIHTKEKPYECDICKKRFTVNCDLKTHYRIHTKEKPYECEICKKRCTLNSNLKKHYCVHSKEKTI